MNRFLSLAAILGLTLLALNMPAATALQLEQQNYRISKTISLGAPDRWDYVVYDPDSIRVYVAHGDRVTVVNGESGALIGPVVGMPGGTHGIAISHSTGKGYTDDGKSGEVVEFDLQTLKVIRRIKAESDAD